MPRVPRRVDGLICILSFFVMPSENLFAFSALHCSSLKTVTHIHRKIWNERSSDHLANKQRARSGPVVPGFFKIMVQAEAVQEGKAEGNTVNQKRLSPPPSSPGYLSQGIIIAAQLAEMPLVIRREHARAGTTSFSSDLPFSST